MDFSSYGDGDPSAIGDDPTSFNFDSLYDLPMRFFLDREKAKGWMEDTEVPEVVQRPGGWWDEDLTPAFEKPLPEPFPHMGGQSGLEGMKGEDEVPTAMEHQVMPQEGDEALHDEADRLTKSPSKVGTTGLGVQEETPSQDPRQDEIEEDGFEVNEDQEDAILKELLQGDEEPTEEEDTVPKEVDETGVQKNVGLEDGVTPDEEEADGEHREADEPPSETGYLTPQETPKYSAETEGGFLK